MSSRSKNLPVPGAVVSDLHKVFFVVAFAIIKLVPLIRRPLLYASSIFVAVFAAVELSWPWTTVDFPLVSAIIVTATIFFTELMLWQLSLIGTKKLLALYSLMTVTSVCIFLFAAHISEHLTGVQAKIFAVCAVVLTLSQAWLAIFSKWCVNQSSKRTKMSPPQNQKTVLIHLLTRLEAKVLSNPSLIEESQSFFESASRITADIEQISSDAMDSIGSTLVAITEGLDGGEPFDPDLLRRNPWVAKLHQNADRDDRELKRLLQQPITFGQRQVIAVIHAYRSVIPAEKRRACNYSPSCSEYVERAVLKFGVCKGGAIGLVRMCSCVPKGPTGWDPVPKI